MVSYELFVGIPSYNAASSVAGILKDLDGNPRVRTVILVDDASQDDTQRILSQPKFRKLHYVRNPSNLGYGASVKVLFSEFQKISSNPNDLLIIVHADGQMPVDEIPLFTQAYEKGGVDLVMGSRMLAGLRAQLGNRSLFRILSDYLLTKTQNFLYGLSVSTYAIGYRAFRREALERLNVEACDKGFNFDTEIILEAKRAGLRTLEIPVRTVKSAQASNNQLSRYAWGSVKTFFKYGPYLIRKRR